MAIEVPDYVSEAAQRGLDWHAEGKSGDGVKDATIREARDMVAGAVSEDKVRRMGPWFRRHATDMDAPDNKPAGDNFPGAGAVAWALWGGPTSSDIMRTAEWAEAKVAQLDKEALAVSNLCKIKMTIEDNLSAAELLAEALTAERDDLRATVEKLTIGAASDLEVAKADIVSKDAKLNDLGAALELANALTVELTAKVADLEAGKVSASKEAAKIAASVGVTPTAIIPGAEAKTDKVDHLAEYAKLEGHAKADYFAKHAQAIYASIKL